MRKLLIVFTSFIALLFSNPVHAEIGQEETFSLLQDAFQAQLDLTEKYRSREEVQNILAPYFTKEYIEKFLDEHLMKDDYGYRIFGSDVFTYFIPFYSYNENTKISYEKGKVLVFEYFTKSFEGPVIWDDHYEGLTLTKTEEGWKIADFYYGGQVPTLVEKNLKRKY